MKVRIPARLSKEERASLEDCVTYAANGANVSDERVLVIMSLLFERIADNMCAGRVVPIPTFGKFGAWLEERPNKIRRLNQGIPYCVPAFVPTAELRAQVRTTAPHSRNAKRTLRDLQRNSTRRANANTLERVHSKGAKFRDAITRQLEFD